MTRIVYILSMKGQLWQLKQWWKYLKRSWDTNPGTWQPYYVLHYQHPVVQSGMNCLETAFSNGVHNLYNQALFAYAYGLADEEKRYQFFLEKLDKTATRDGKHSMAMIQAIQVMEWPVVWCKLFEYSFLVHAAHLPFHACSATEFISMNFSVSLFWLHKRWSCGLIFSELWNMGKDLWKSQSKVVEDCLVPPLASSSTHWTNSVPLTVSCAPVCYCFSICCTAFASTTLWLM